MSQRFLDPRVLNGISGLDLIARTVVDGFVAGPNQSEQNPIGERGMDLHQWLAGFDPGSLLELDYATLCDFMTWDELDDDRSSRDLHEALDALERELVERDHPR